MALVDEETTRSTRAIYLAPKQSERAPMLVLQPRFMKHVPPIKQPLLIGVDLLIGGRDETCCFPRLSSPQKTTQEP